MPVSQTAWADNGAFVPNRGQFPIRVERHLNAFVADHVPGITTVTASARYYTLHGLVAHVADERELTEEAKVQLLRRSEVLLAFVTRRHASQPNHPSETPDGHGIDAIVARAEDNGVDLSVASADRAYSSARWGFSNAYRGSELFLQILQPAGNVNPGRLLVPRAVEALTDIVGRADGPDFVSTTEADQLAECCLCRMPDGADGPWFADLLAGRRGDDANPTRGVSLRQLGVLVRTAALTGRTRGVADLRDRIMFDHELAAHPAVVGLAAADRWRGALLRAEAVWAWRRLWFDLSAELTEPMSVAELAAKFAAKFTDQTVEAFREQLPSVVDSAGRPVAAERQLTELPKPDRPLSSLILAADRQRHLTGQELVGFLSSQEVVRGSAEELTPAWTTALLTRHREGRVEDLVHALSVILIHRSQRVALAKSTFNRRTGRFSYPARIHVRDGIALHVFQETAPAPATRLPQYLSIAAQTGLFAIDSDGQLQPGPHGASLA